MGVFAVEVASDLNSVCVLREQALTDLKSQGRSLRKNAQKPGQKNQAIKLTGDKDVISRRRFIEEEHPLLPSPCWVARIAA